MNDRQIYLQPLSLLRGCFDSNENLKNISNSGMYFSLLKIITRDEMGVSSEIIHLSQLDDFLSKKPKDIREEIIKTLTKVCVRRPKIALKNNKTLNWDKPIIQGVLNVTPDSFSDGGFHNDIDDAVSVAHKMICAGADIIDIGGESTKPGAKPVSIEAEKERVLPVIRKLVATGVPISVDTRNADVMAAAIEAGAVIINDVSALEYDQNSLQLVKESGFPVILMHSQGTPETMQKNPKYENVLLDIYDYLEARIEVCLKAGMSLSKIIIDPGIGFGKTVEHNLQIIANISLFHGLGVPILIGTSRKSFIGKLTGQEEAMKRVSGSIASAQICLDQGVQILRVHDIEETAQAISIWNAVSNGKDIL